MIHSTNPPFLRSDDSDIGFDDAGLEGLGEDASVSSR